MTTNFDASFARRDSEIRARHGKPWTPDEYARLEEMLLLGAGLKAICEDLQRPADGTLTKLVQKRLLHHDYVSNTYTYTSRALAALEQLKANAADSHITNETDMNKAPVIETKTFISGVEAAGMSDMEIFKKIAELEKLVENWKSIKVTSKKLEALISKTEADIQKLAEYVDSREA